MMNTVCPHCGQVTSAETPGVETCEHCGEVLDVAAVDDQSVQEVQVGDLPAAAATEDALAEFVVFDREGPTGIPVVHAPRQSPSGAGAGELRRGDTDYRRVAVPRSVLYMQGVLLGTVAVGFFALGIVVGMRIGDSQDVAEELPQPCVVTGAVVYRDELERKIPDDQAVVLLLPADSLPQKKPPPSGLRPDDEPPGEDHPGLSAIREIGGDYGRTDSEGRFELRVLGAQPFYVLYISSRLRRSGEELAKRDLAELSAYFLPAQDLIGRNKYAWRHVASIRGSRHPADLPQGR